MEDEVRPLASVSFEHSPLNRLPMPRPPQSCSTDTHSQPYGS
jgi:hypothetical protein